MSFPRHFADHGVRRARQGCGGGWGGSRGHFKGIAVSSVTLQLFRDCRLTGLSPLSLPFSWMFWSVDFPASVTQSNISFLACLEREPLLRLSGSQGKVLVFTRITQGIILQQRSRGYRHLLGQVFFLTILIKLMITSKLDSVFPQRSIGI